MDINTVRGLITLIVMLAFIGVWVWAWSRKRRKDFDEASRLPFRDETGGDAEERQNKGDRK